jgi:3-dehydroquinate dehydratase
MELLRREHLAEKHTKCETLEARVDALEEELRSTQKVLRGLLETLEQKFVVGFDEEEHLSSRVL